MSEVRDKVARAICIEHDENPDEMLGDGGVEWYKWEQYDTLADAAVAAFLEAIKEQGWQIVPRDATEKMLDEGNAPHIGEYGFLNDEELIERYRAMLAAAPEWKP